MTGGLVIIHTVRCGLSPPSIAVAALDIKWLIPPLITLACKRGRRDPLDLSRPPWASDTARLGSSISIGLSQLGRPHALQEVRHRYLESSVIWMRAFLGRPEPQDTEGLSCWARAPVAGQGWTTWTRWCGETYVNLTILRIRHFCQ